MSAVPDRVKSVLSGARAPRIAEGVLVVLLGALLGLAFLKLIAPLPTPKGDALAAAASSGRTQRNDALVVKSPFPKVEVAAALADQAPEVEETSLDLTLTGVWPGEDLASAIIRKPDGKQETFGIGDAIVPGVALVAVYSDQVIIEQNGVRESLRFETKARVPSRVTPAPRAPSTPPPQPEEEPQAQQPPTLNELQSLFSLGAVEDANGERAIGIFAGNDKAKFQQTGLQNGDVLRSINGAPTPKDPAALMRLMQQVAQSGEADIVVERNGEVQSVSLSLKELGSQ